MAAPGLYAIPVRFRRTENLHILFWLIKDISWAMLWKPIGLFMLVPTIGVAIIITWQTRKILSELFHNLAVCFWITANGYWMIVEFWEVDDSYRYFTAIPFSLGILSLLAYYIFVMPREKYKREAINEEFKQL